MKFNTAIIVFLVLAVFQNASAASWESRQQLCAERLIEVMKNRGDTGKFVKNITRKNEGRTLVRTGRKFEYYLVQATVSGEVVAAAECFVQPTGRRIMRFNVTMEPSVAQRWLAAKI